MIRFTIKSQPASSVPLAAFAVQSGGGITWSRSARRFPAGLLKAAREDGFKADLGARLPVRPWDGNPAARLLLMGAGKPGDLKPATLRKLGAEAAKWALEARPRALALLLPDETASLADEAQAVVEGFLLGHYRFQRHQAKPDIAPLPTEIIFVAPEGNAAAIRAAAQRGETFAQAANFARDLINEPPSLKVAEKLGQVAKGLAKSGVRVRVFHKREIAAMKMEALLGVNRGSAHPPVLVHLHYKPAVRPSRRVAFVGKGITFDSGGLSLKTADGMMTMKYDMAGAATVFALFKALARLRPTVEVHGITPITENMPGQDAYKPGDVVRAANGKTIEVLNTDAEGRVILADGLSFAARLPVDEIIDIATLTGAANIALGRAYAALMTNNDGVARRLGRASEAAGEKVWQLPLEPSYKDHIKSKVADLKNIGNPGEAGTIIGGLFLQEFVDGKPWAHLDIASCGWNSDGSVWGAPGATGVMVRTLLNYIGSV